MATPDASARGAVKLRVVKTRVITGTDAATLETNLNAFYRDFDDVTGHTEGAVLLSVETVEFGTTLAAIVTYTE